MALDPTARESNYKDSIKKFFVDNISTTEKIKVVFDKALEVPVVQGTGLLKWINIDFGPIERSGESFGFLDVHCCTREDPEGYQLAHLSDTVRGYLSDTTKSDGMKRIDFYRSFPPPTAWVLLGALLVTSVTESSNLVAADGTKFKILTVELKWAAKV